MTTTNSKSYTTKVFEVNEQGDRLREIDNTAMIDEADMVDIVYYCECGKEVEDVYFPRPADPTFPNFFKCGGGHDITIYR